MYVFFAVLAEDRVFESGAWIAVCQGTLLRVQNHKKPANSMCNI